jgi:hypothetical protein
VTRRMSLLTTLTATAFLTTMACGNGNNSSETMTQPRACSRHPGEVPLAHVPWITARHAETGPQPGVKTRPFTRTIMANNAVVRPLEIGGHGRTTV